MSNEKTESAQSAVDVSQLSEELNQIASQLFENNQVLKEVENEKSRLRSKFFDLASEYIKTTQTLAHEYIEGEFTVASANKFVEDNYPDWRLVKRDDEGILIEEDPTKMKFVWTSDDGVQCARNIAVVGAKFDVDLFVEEHPDIAKSVVSEKVVYEFDEDKAQKIIDENPDLLPIFQNYATIGKIQTKLASPKIVEKEEE